MEKILKRLDLQASSAEALYYCIDSYYKEEYEYAMSCQFEYLRSLYDMECIYNDMDEEESELFLNILVVVG
jgi:hypothetical protein